MQEGVILRRSELPNGDVIVTLLSEASKWRAVARKGKLIGGNLGKLSLFHDVTVQHYTRPNGSDDLALITQVQLNGALPRLSDPAIYPYAHVLAELTDKLAVDVHLDGGFYEYFTGALRGLSSQPDPERVALIMGWRLLAQAGLAPRTTRCARCGERDLEGDDAPTFDAAAGGGGFRRRARARAGRGCRDRRGGTGRIGEGGADVVALVAVLADELVELGRLVAGRGELVLRPLQGRHGLAGFLGRRRLGQRIAEGPDAAAGNQLQRALP